MIDRWEGNTIVDIYMFRADVSSSALNAYEKKYRITGKPKFNN